MIQLFRGELVIPGRDMPTVFNLVEEMNRGVKMEKTRRLKFQRTLGNFGRLARSRLLILKNLAVA